MANDMFKKDLYSILDVAEDATDKEITSAYRKMALKCHPDKNPDNPKAAELFHELSKALEILTDVATRADYDQARKAKKAAEERDKVLDSDRLIQEGLRLHERGHEWLGEQKRLREQGQLRLQEQLREGKRLREQGQLRLQEQLREGKLLREQGQLRLQEQLREGKRLREQGQLRLQEQLREGKRLREQGKRLREQGQLRLQERLREEKRLREQEQLRLKEWLREQKQLREQERLREQEQ